MSDNREKALKALKAQIRARQAEIDPQILSRTQKAAESYQPETESKSDTVPYDTEAARKAITLFLQYHPEQKRFSEELFERMKKEDS